MGDNSAIEWTDATWNPTVGCTRISAGCKHCYFMTMHDRRHAAWLAGKWPAAPRQYHVPATEMQMFPERLDQPMRWRRPRRIFVNSLSDLFHEDIPLDFVGAVFGIACLAQRHTFQILTKRPAAMHNFMLAWNAKACIAMARRRGFDETVDMSFEWPPRNVWLGTSVENQKAADERIPLLVETPAAVRFLSCEPLLGPVDLDSCTPDGEASWQNIDWVICGGESGVCVRPMHPDWARDLRDQCTGAGVNFFFKQWGEWAPSPAVPIRGVYTGGGIFLLPDGKWGNQGDWWDGRAVAMDRMGKKRAGRLLDGREWNEIPRCAG